MITAFILIVSIVYILYFTRYLVNCYGGFDAVWILVKNRFLKK